MRNGDEPDWHQLGLIKEPWWSGLTEMVPASEWSVEALDPVSRSRLGETILDVQHRIREWLREQSVVLTIQEAASEAGVAQAMIRNAIRRGDLTPIPTNSSGVYRLELQRWIDARRIRTEDQAGRVALIRLGCLLANGWTPDRIAALLGSKPATVQRWTRCGVPKGLRSRLDALVTWTEQGHAGNGQPGALDQIARDETR